MASNVRITLDGASQLGPKLQVRAKQYSEKMTRAIQSVSIRVKAEIEEQGRENIRAGGNFGSERWQQGFQAKVSFGSATDLRIRVTHAVAYWRVFEFGAVIHGKPLLWIPLKGTMADALGVRARDFPMPLFRVDRKTGGAPLLMAAGGKAQYFGKEQVRIPKKWTLRVIVRNIARNMPTYYREAMRAG